MTDLLLYRMNLVPELNYLKFLQLIGIELAPAQPAVAEITFPVQNTATSPWISIPAGTAVAAEGGDDATPVVFETSLPLIALKATLAAVQILDGYSYLNVTPTNDAATEGFEPFGPAASEGSAMMLGFDFNDAFPEVELSLAVFAEEKQTQEDVTASCGTPASASLTTSQISWE